ncbi:MAG TPA: fumarylacetoacetate hydrolase family protein [Dongiaceae bacterium]|jgi:2-keto-4-pentenoate hydratase
MDSEAIRRAALLIRSCWEERRRMAALPEDCRPKRLRDGYEIQAALEPLHGPTIGWKIAATSEAGQKHIGVDAPLAGRLFKRFAQTDGALLPAAHLHMRVAEAEFAFKMKRDLPPRPDPYSQGEVMAAVDTLHLAIEVPDSRYDDFVTIGAPSLVADDSCAAYFVLGPEAPNWRSIDLPSHKVTARKNGTDVAEGSGANVLGDPRAALAWIANDLQGRGDFLRAGEIVTTGTCVKPVDIAPGDSVVMDFGALGKVRAAFSD